MEPAGRHGAESDGSKVRPLTSPVRLVALRRLFLVATTVVLGSCNSINSPVPASSITLEVGATGGLPGFQQGELPFYLALHMTDAGLTKWRFEPAISERLSANYVEWTFTLKPYAESEVLSHRPHHLFRGSFSGLHSVTLEARLYLNGEYQTLVVGQALMGGPQDRHLGLAITTLTRSLLGPAGAYRRVDVGQRPTDPAR